MTYNWKEAGINEITNLYLYGRMTVPVDKTDASLIRSKAVDEYGKPKHGASITVDMASFMATGPGRFALGSESPLVKLFFTADLSWMEPWRIYSKAEMLAAFDLHPKEGDWFVIAQVGLDDFSGDYWERSYIWNNGLYGVGNDAVFSIDAYGNRVIQNYTIRAFDDNFDFIGSGGAAKWGNDYLEPRIDPWKMGLRVELALRDTNNPLPSRDYTENDYWIDVANYLSYQAAGVSKIFTSSLVAMDEILTQLWNGGTTKLLYQSKPIIYGTVEADMLSASDLPNLSVSSYLFLYHMRYPSTGVVLIAAKGNDTLTGGNYADALHGGDGDDVYSGGGGDDYLKDEAGNDTYTINVGDGVDTVLDADGSGAVRFGAMAVEGRSGVADGKDWAKLGNAWMDRQNGIVYVLEAQNDGSNDLLVWSNNGSGVRIKAWNDGKLGITSGENTQPAALLFDKTIKEKYPDYDDTLEGAAGNDLIQGFGGNDVIIGHEGDDRMEGGPGQDALFGKLGHDVGLGGADSDRVAGQEGNDRLFADTEYTIDEAIALGETQSGSGQRGDMLDGGPDNDLAIAGAGDDILMGGKGKDILIGLGGNDTIEGDNDFTGSDLDWNVERKTSSSGSSTIYVRDYNFPTTSVSPDVGGDDAIYGGVGNDWIFTQGGNDFVDAGADDDVVFGEGGTISFWDKAEAIA
jgi:Ca2+-binding RTX toxin-like protein